MALVAAGGKQHPQQMPKDLEELNSPLLGAWPPWPLDISHPRFTPQKVSFQIPV